jgi:hypothetical protein
MRTNDILYELDLLGAVLSQEVCVGFERCEVVFSGSALVGAEGNACLVQFGEGFGNGLNPSVVEGSRGTLMSTLRKTLLSLVSMSSSVRKSYFFR